MRLKHATLVFMVAAAAWLASILFGMWLGQGTAFLLTVGGALVVLLLGGIALLAAALNPAPGKRRRVLSVVVGLLAAVLLFWPASMGASWLFWRSRAASLDQFTAEVLRDGRVRDMSDGQRFYKSLNGSLISYVDTTRTNAPNPPRSTVLPLAQVLERDGLDRATYERYRRRLIELRFIKFAVTSEYVGFVYDGFLDNLDGYLWVRPGHEPPLLGASVFETQLVSLRHMGGNWYSFGTT